MAKAQEVLYAVVGAGDFVVDKARSAGKLADRKTTTNLYKDFVARGRALSSGIGKSAPTRHAVAQSKAARAKVKAAATSAGKAVRANSKAVSSAAGKAAKKS